MKNLKRAISVFLAVTILALANIQGVATATTAKSKVFSDVKASAWYKQYVDDISSKGIIEGIGNGKFGPNDKLTVDQLLTMMVKANKLTAPKQSTDTYWGSPFVRKAKEMGWVKDSEFKDYKVAITRGEIARIIARAMPNSETPISLSEYQNMFKDYEEIDPTMRTYILKVRAAGIISGYYDAKYDTDKFSSDPYRGMVFGAKNTATRAEASTMIVNYITPEKRVEPSVVIGETKAYYNGFTTGIEGVNTALIFIDGTPESENTDGESPLVSFDVLFWNEYKYQPELAAQGYLDAKKILLQQLDEKTVDAAIAYGKTKTDPEMKLDTKWFVSADKKYTIGVESMTYQLTYIDFSVYYNQDN